MKILFEMTEEDRLAILEACKPVALIAIHCGPISSRQENANNAWERLGQKMGFKYMTVEPIPGKGQRCFMAEPVDKS